MRFSSEVISGRCLPATPPAFQCTRCVARERRLLVTARAGVPAIGLLGTKAGMTQIFSEGLAIPASVIAFDKGNVVTQVCFTSFTESSCGVDTQTLQNTQRGLSVCLQIKTDATDGYNSVQVGYEVVPERKITKPELNHLKKADAPALRSLREFKVRSLPLPCSQVKIASSPV